MSVYISDLYYLMIVVSILVAFYLIYESYFSNSIIKQKVQISKAYKDILSSFSDKTKDEMFDRVGVKLSVKRYTAYRNLITMILLFISLTKVVSGEPITAIKLTIFTAAIMIITVPKDEIIKGKKSPFKIMTDLIYKKRQNQLDNELTNVVAQMRNLIISNGSAISADYIFTRLVPHTNISKQIFVQTHSFLQKGRKKDAADYFKKAFNTWLGGEFSQILIKLDTLPPAEFMQQIEILQESMEDVKETETDKKRENNKALIFTFAALQLALIIFNFIYIILADSIRAISG